MTSRNQIEDTIRALWAARLQGDLEGTLKGVAEHAVFSLNARGTGEKSLSERSTGKAAIRPVLRQLIEKLALRRLEADLPADRRRESAASLDGPRDLRAHREIREFRCLRSHRVSGRQDRRLSSKHRHRPADVARGVGGRSYSSTRDSRIRRVPWNTGFSGSITKRMRGRSVSTVQQVPTIGLASCRLGAFHAAASNVATCGLPRSAL